MYLHQPGQGSGGGAGECGAEGDAECTKPFPPEHLGFYLFCIIDFQTIFYLGKNLQNSTIKFEKQKLRVNVYA